jgi:hypothetical protein
MSGASPKARVWLGQSVDCAELLANFPVALLVAG